jgi:plasmid maintenance system antidote protein VapI
MVDEAMKKRLIEVLAGANLAQLADEMDVSPQAINNWKNRGKITKDNAFTLARLRGFNPEWLITGFGKKTGAKESRDQLNIARLRDVMDAIEYHEKHRRIELSSLMRAKWINEIYCDLALKTKADFLRRTAEIIELSNWR